VAESQNSIFSEIAVTILIICCQIVIVIVPNKSVTFVQNNVLSDKYLDARIESCMPSCEVVVKHV
jgi:hypothetical protein